MKRFRRTILLGLASALALTSCGGSKDKAKQTVKTSGSNTLAPVVTAWAEEWKDGTATVAGVGTGVGIEDLINGRCDICNASRAMKDEEKAKLKEKTGKDAVEFTIGYDALALYTHPSNPVTEISLPELTGIFKQGGGITSWDAIAGGQAGEIVPFGREKTSGTYEYFHEKIVGKKESFVASISPQSSSNAIIEQLATVKNGIGYDGMAFKNAKVKWLKLSKEKGQPAVEPNADDARSGKYPLARPLFLYTVGQPEGAVKEFIDFALSDEGQKLLSKTGTVSLR